MPRRPRPWFRKSKNAWFAQVGKKQIRLAEGRANRADAERALLELLLARSISKPFNAPNHDIASIIDHYLTRAKIKLAERTHYERKKILQRFAEDRGEVTVADCSPLHLSDWIDSQAAWKSAWTRNTVNAVVQRAFNWAVKQRIIAANPFTGVSYATGQPRRPMTDDEFRALLRATATSYGKTLRPTPGARFRQLLCFMRWTGCRPGEASALRWANINLDAGQIVILDHKTAKTQREPRPRVIVLTPLVCRLLASIRRLEQHGEIVFLNHRKTVWNRSNLSLRIRRLKKVAGLPDDLKLYGLRHGFGTRAILNGVDLKTLATLLGHTTTRMSEWYIHLAGQREHLAAAMQRATSHDPTRRSNQPPKKPPAT